MTIRLSGTISIRAFTANPLWTDLDKIPYERMWEDDQHWLPQMLAGQKFLGKFIFEGESIQWREITWESETDTQWLFI